MIQSKFAMVGETHDGIKGVKHQRHHDRYRPGEGKLSQCHHGHKAHPGRNTGNVTENSSPSKNEPVKISLLRFPSEMRTLISLVAHVCDRSGAFSSIDKLA